MNTRSRFYPILSNKCPRCQQGDFFVHKSAFSRHFDQMHEHCPVCGLRYTPEPGFYWASMFVSYAFFTAWTLLTFFITVIWLQVDLDYYLIGLVPTLFILMPFFFRLARRCWLAMFVKPNPTFTRLSSEAQ